MSAATGPKGSPTSRGRQGPKAKQSFWTMSIGGSGKSGADDHVEHEEFAPHLPGVNLLPARVRESIAIGKSRTLLLLAIVLLAAATMGLWWMQTGTVQQAEAALARSQKLHAELVDQTAALAPAKQFYSEVSTLEDLISMTLADQPQAREVLDRLNAAVAATGGKPPIGILSAAVTYTGVPQPGEPLSSCPNPDPFNEEITVGCLTFSASASTRAQVSDLLRSLEADPLFVGPYVTSTTATGADEGGAGSVTFSGSSGISVEGLATPPTPEQIDALLNPPAAENVDDQQDPSAAEGDRP